MGRSPCCAKEGMNRGAWTATEDKLLVDYISSHGEGRWRSIPKEAGLKRCGKSCRLRWLNYLRPDIKRGNITADEDDLIIRLHKLLGNRWSLIAGRLPGRTDNEIKNYWNTTLLKKIQGGGGDQSPNPSEGKDTRKRAKKAPQPEAASKAVRTKAVRCSKAVVIAPPPRLENVDRSTECGIENTSPTSSYEDYSALDKLPIEINEVFVPGEDPLSCGSDPNFWTMLNDWIMDDEDPNCHS